MPQTETIIFGGGCFWCTEAVFHRLRGVTSVTPGYAGGHTEDPGYYRVATGKTGHAEVIEVQFDPDKMTLEQLFAVFFTVHDPTTLNRQGADTGTEYRSIILATSAQQEEAARAYIAQLESEGLFPDPIVTQVQQLDAFYEAEQMHQQYYDKNEEKPYCQIVINPKLQKLKKSFAHLLKDEYAA